MAVDGDTVDSPFLSAVSARWVDDVVGPPSLVDLEAGGWMVVFCLAAPYPVIRPTLRGHSNFFLPPHRQRRPTHCCFLSFITVLELAVCFLTPLLSLPFCCFVEPRHSLRASFRSFACRFSCTPQHALFGLCGLTARQLHHIPSTLLSDILFFRRSWYTWPHSA